LILHWALLHGSPNSKFHQSRFFARQFCQQFLQTMKSKLVFLLLSLVAVLASACGESGPQRYRVTGEVNWEGKPVPSGSIVFTPAERGVTDAGKIVDGKFDTQVTAGKKKIAITATREAGPVDPAMGMARRESYVPAQYNQQTTLEKEVTPGGQNHFKFDLVP
jgi:hypothetical protein